MVGRYNNYSEYITIKYIIANSHMANYIVLILRLYYTR